MRAGTIWGIVAALTPVAAQASVSLKNGNFFISYRDVAYNGGLEMKIERVYNSKASFEGMFGFGWGSDYEAYLELFSDGSIVVHENGGGAGNVFRTPDAARIESLTAASVDAIAKVALEAKWITRDGFAAYRQRLADDARYRHDQESKARKEKRIAGAAFDPPIGTAFESQKFGHQRIERTRDGYLRETDGGMQSLFDAQGRLLEMRERNGRLLTFVRETSGRLSKIADDQGNELGLTLNAAGQAVRIEGTNRKPCVYEYADGDLRKATDSDGVTHEYSYDDRHNLTRIGYADGTAMEISYNSVDHGETVRTVTDRDQTITLYSYFGGVGARALRYGTGLETVAADGSLISESSYRYEEAIGLAGERYVRRMLTDVDGDRTNTTYGKEGLPLSIERNGDVTSFEYDARGHVTRKQTPSEITELIYGDPCAKVTSVQRRPASATGETQTATFVYDDHCNLTIGESGGKTVRITYDSLGRIDTLTGDDGIPVRFVYNKDSRPKTISKEGVGAINVTYTPGGEVEKVDSGSDRRIALTVTSAFQTLLDIIRPAGITLSF